MSMADDPFDVSCPVPLAPEFIQLSHGGGGSRMRRLVEEVFLPAFGSPELLTRHDSAVLPFSGGRLAFTTDAYVVHPLFFPGGDIGKIAVFGTVNDLAMSGARPVGLSASFILEEGLCLDVLRRVVESMKNAAAEAGIRILTGDTKVVDKGKGDGIFITTSGVGIVPDGIDIAPQRVCPGDAILISGDVGRHGIAVLSVREGLSFEAPVQSDAAPLSGGVEALLRAGIEVHCLRDLTRGGLGAALNEIAVDAAVGMVVREESIPVSEAVAGACELFGLDPLYVACEGRMVIVLPEAEAERALGVLWAHPCGGGAARIGSVMAAPAGRVLLRTRLGSSRSLDLLSGEQLPRIC